MASPSLSRTMSLPSTQTYDHGAARTIKQLFWLYVLLLIFEGALRKWFLPGLATPLLIARDPVALLILLQAAASRFRVLNPYTLVSFAFTIVAFFLALAVGHQNLMVDIFGARITALHFPLIFVLGQVLTRDDVLQVGRFILWLVIPMVILIGIQFYSPQSAWVNRGVGGDMEGAGFSGAMGYFRPPGTFSFTIGVTLFFDLAASFVAYFWISRKHEISSLLLLVATAGVLLAIPLSLSRGYVFQLGITIAFLLIASFRSGRSFGRIVIFLLVLPPALLIMYQFPFFQTSIDVLLTRFTLAAKSEGGSIEGTLMTRFLGGNLGAINNSTREGLWGFGMGMGTNVGSKLISGELVFLVGENEWQRVMGEFGPFIGIIAIGTRVVLAIHLMLKSLATLLTNSDALPWILLSFGLVQIVYGQWGPPTILGFGILTASLIVAAINDPYTENQDA
ncbi:hypothetical protein GGR28_001640 [Lewinella aquimaris]|uniref:Uncharacterized protein n=1 Tax=Neolewinella aquimaris TaxID=1835722 RepID=A0A840E502_9BACT|nr:hypothetical protein [Neolewinella aquimaris]MBB4079023.1 hypothetical protein [Neolewinella aquimaris]